MSEDTPEDSQPSEEEADEPDDLGLLSAALRGRTNTIELNIGRIRPNST